MSRTTVSKQALTRAREGAARDRFGRIVGDANHVRLMTEESIQLNRERLGNFPQGFTHLALARAALNLADAERVERQKRSEPPVGRRHPVTQTRER